MDNKNDLSRPCAICGETLPDSFKIWFDGYVKVYKCLSCGFVSQFSGPGIPTIVYDYQDCYSLDFLHKGQEFLYPHRRNNFQDIVNRIVSLKKTGDILDVGCGDGHFLYLCTLMGFNCIGVEGSKILQSYALRKTGAKVILGHYTKEMFSAESFDVITLIQVLEHIPNPKVVLEAVYYHLRPNGIIIIEIPSINSPHFLLYRFTGIKRFVKPPHGVILSHFGYYTPNTLKLLTNGCGFNKLSTVTGRWQFKYTGILNKLGKLIDPVFNVFKIGGILYIGNK